MQTATITEKQLLLDELNQSEQALVASAQVPEEHARIAPQADSWAVLDVVEHITLSDRRMLQRYREGTANPNPVNLEADAFIRGLTDRSKKRTAPEQVTPNRRFSSLAEAVGEYRSSRAEILAFVEGSAEDFRKKLVKHPVMEMDGHQLFLLIAAHSRRHAAQIQEVKNSPAFVAAMRQAKAN